MPLSIFRRAWLLLFAVVAAHAESAPLVSVPRFTHPGAGQTFYFLLTDRFANGRADNDTGGIAGGPAVSGFDPTKISHFHGGDFAGLTAHLDYLKRLGVTAVWVSPPFKNKPMQSGTAGYHGYWVTDFLSIDPHFGTNAEFAEFVRQAHARGLKVYMDIIANHTADVIQFNDGTAYRDRASAPYCDATGKIFDERALAYNGLGEPVFPTLSAERSFPHVPVVPSAEAAIKNPAWLNDVTLYHNRGNTNFHGENALYGDFVGLDDLFTEHPRVVQGMIDIFTHWLREYGVDGFRIDTVKHVNAEFWQAFAPALRAEARRLGRPGFLMFGEASTEHGGAEFLSEFSTGIPLDAALDFSFFHAARDFVSKGGAAAELADFFAQDDYYTDHDSNVQAATTFLGNHDNGRFGYFLLQDNPHAAPEQLADLVALGHGLLLLARGQPVIYYGDEQGMLGRGGDDMQAREDMFASRAPVFAGASLLATKRTGADDKFDETHPFYRLIARLTALRAQHAALRTGAMLPRETAEKNVFAFSRIARDERIEYLVALNNSRTQCLRVAVPTNQRAGAMLRSIFDSRAVETASGGSSLTIDARGRAEIDLAPLQFAVWRAAAPLAIGDTAPEIAWAAPQAGTALAFSTREVDGQVFASRQELRANVHGGDGFAEVTFTMIRASRPDQIEWLGTDDTPPYRIFWRPPPDLAPGEKLTFIATVNDLRGHRASAQLGNITVASADIAFGIRGAQVPRITRMAAPVREVAAGTPVAFEVEAGGTGPLEFQWLRNDELIASAEAARYALVAGPAVAGRYRAMVRNRAGTVLTPEFVLEPK